MRSTLPMEEDDALRRILRHHGVAPSKELTTHLAELLNWVRQSEQSKASFGAIPKPPLMLAFLSTLGIYGAEAINSIEVKP